MRGSKSFGRNGRAKQLHRWKMALRRCHELKGPAESEERLSSLVVLRRLVRPSLYGLGEALCPKRALQGYLYKNNRTEAWAERRAKECTRFYVGNVLDG